MQVTASLDALHDLADFQRLAEASLGPHEMQRLLRHPRFFSAPRQSEQAVRQHSMLVDKILGFDMKAVEAALVKQGQVVLPQGSYESWGPALHNGSQTWVGLDAQRLNTPYDVLRKMIQLLKPRDNELVVDLGAGMGRLGVVLAMLAPQAQFLGFEYVPERVQMARAIYQRWNCSKALCEVKDLMASDFVLPQAAVYFIYDYGKREHILQTLKQIQRVSCGRPVRLVARGHATWRLVEEYCADFTETFAGDDIENFRIYRC